MAEKSILIVQPVYTAYRAPFFEAIKSLNSNTKIVCAKSDSSFGFKDSNDDQLYFFVDWGTASFRKISFELAKLIIQSDIVVHVGDFKYASFWFSVLVRFILRKKTYIHGQGGYKRKGLIHTLVYNFTVFTTSNYICYNEFCVSALKSKLLNSLQRKVRYVNNTLYLTPVIDLVPAKDNYIFYIGRLRAGCEIEMLLEAASACSVRVKVVGGGDSEYIEALNNRYDNLEYHGTIFEESIQKSIASECFAGAYAGDAGLSVVHYFALGLPVIVHNDTFKHMGPEPDYVVDKVNGLKFQRESLLQLTDCIKTLKTDIELRTRLSIGALETFKRLNTPPMHEKFAKILGLI